MRQFGSATKRLFGSRQIVEFEETFPASRPGEPVLRVLVDHELKYGHRFVASASLIESEGNLHVRICKIQRHWTVVRRVSVGDCEDRQIILPHAFLLYG